MEQGRVRLLTGFSIEKVTLDSQAVELRPICQLVSRFAFTASPSYLGADLKIISWILIILIGDCWKVAKIFNRAELPLFLVILIDRIMGLSKELALWNQILFIDSHNILKMKLQNIQCWYRSGIILLSRLSKVKIIAKILKCRIRQN